jgi:glycosyltransferase involved in cell wall biosynthesis
LQAEIPTEEPRLSEQFSVSVIVCTRNRPKALSACLESLWANRYPKFEIVVVDNCSTDASTRQTAEQYGVRYLSEPTAGLSRARNSGVRASNSDLVAFIDDDAVAAEDWIQQLASRFENERVGLVTGRIVSRASNDSDDVDHGFSVDRDMKDWFITTNFGGLGDANVAIRRSCFGQWQGFHEGLGRGCQLDSLEEHYAYFQLVELGYVAVHNPRATYYHEQKLGAELEARMRRDHASAAAYILFLFKEHPKYRMELLRFVTSRILKQVATRLSNTEERMSFRTYTAAWLSGIKTYWKFLRDR